VLPRRRAALITTGFALALAPGAVGAEPLAGDPAPPAVALDYEAAEACPSSAVFATALAARGVLIQPAPEASLVRVRIAAQPAGFSGTLTISSASGPFLERNLDALDCGEIVSAFALVAAITAARGSTAPESAESKPDSVDAKEAPPEKKPVPSPKPPAKPEAEDSNTSELRSDERERSSARFGTPERFALALGTLLHEGVLPEFGAGILLSGKHTWLRDSPLSPAVALGLSWSRQELVRIGRARFDWVSLHAALCPWRWPGGSGFELRPCFAVETGILRGEGLDGRASTASTAWWLAPGLGLRAEARLGRWLLGVSGSASVPLFRDRFYFGPNVGLHRPALVTIGSELSLGLGFW
jgi:hypothetical protein